MRCVSFPFRRIARRGGTMQISLGAKAPICSLGRDISPKGGPERRNDARRELNLRESSSARVYRDWWRRLATRNASREREREREKDLVDRLDSRRNVITEPEILRDPPVPDFPSRFSLHAETGDSRSLSRAAIDRHVLRKAGRIRMPIAEARHVSLSAAAKEDRSVLPPCLLPPPPFPTRSIILSRTRSSADAFRFPRRARISRRFYLFYSACRPTPFLSLYSRSPHRVHFGNATTARPTMLRRYRAARGLRIALLHSLLSFVSLDRKKKRGREEHERVCGYDLTSMGFTETERERQGYRWIDGWTESGKEKQRERERESKRVRA